ncbi:MAG: hypothetical protein M5U15_00940 [Kiritimatiellae bacterium]|nr:hypothetical protein [Kiritimatiellia bacterium]
MASLAFLVIVSVIAFTLPNSWNILRPDLEDAPPAFGRTLVAAFSRGLAYAILFVLCVGTILINSSSPFLYFQF